MTVFPLELHDVLVDLVEEFGARFAAAQRRACVAGARDAAIDPEDTAHSKIEPRAFALVGR